MPFDSFIDILTSKFRDFIPGKSTEYFSGGSPSNPEVTYAPFAGAHDFVIENATFAERMDYVLTKDRTILDSLHPYTDPDAAMDSSARDPPPQCWPGTRVKINAMLVTWLDDIVRGWEMLWIHGPAGTGKSAIAQTFAQTCFEMGRLGAAFFFSRPNGRDKAETVIPSLVYQFCVCCHAYKSVVAKALANDPQLFTKAMSVQFKRLLIEPLSQLKASGHENIRKPFLVLLDGLDECAGGRAQLEFIKLIAEHVRTKPGFPILWLLCSRPEPHLMCTFLRIPECGREELLLDKESRKDVDLFLHERFAEIRDENQYTTSSDWPPEQQLSTISDFCRGHFQVAKVCADYVATSPNPPEQLHSLVKFLKHTEKVRHDNPLAVMDLVYFRIVSDIPSDILQSTMRILAHLFYHSSLGVNRAPSTHCLCNILRFAQSTFYSALNYLHSVLKIPAPEDAHQAEVRFHHASFLDFLLDPSRSGRFLLKRDWAFEVVAEAYLYWHEIDITHFHTNDEKEFHDRNHEHECLHGLTWASPNNQGAISIEVAKHCQEYQHVFAWGSNYRSDNILARLRDFDFRYTIASFVIDATINWVYRHYPSSGVVRTEPSNDVDFQLLEKMKAVTNQDMVKSASLPVKWKMRREHSREYVFLGCGSKAALVLRTNALSEVNIHADILSIPKPLSPKWASDYKEAWLMDQQGLTLCMSPLMPLLTGQALACQTCETARPHGRHLQRVPYDITGGGNPTDTGCQHQ